MKRLFWLGVGIAVGAVVVRRLSRTARAYSPSGLAESARNSAAGLWESVQDFVADVRDGMAEREEEIQAAFAQGVSLSDVDEEELYDELEYGVLNDDEDYGSLDFESKDYGSTGYGSKDQGNGAGVRR
jgi:hypothetical protein